MRLAVEWHGATRPIDERVRVETTIRDSILEFFGGSVEQAKRAKDTYTKQPRRPFLDWSRAVYHGHRAAKGYITPTEYSRLSFTATFEEGLK